MPNPNYCSFCGRSEREVKRVIAGPTVFICDECVDLCKDIIDAEEKGPPADSPATFIVRDNRTALERWCKDIVGEENAKNPLAPRWAVYPARGVPQGSIADWKVVVPSSFGELFEMSWPQATRAAE